MSPDRIARHARIDEILRSLARGNRRFVEDRSHHAGLDRNTRESLVAGQDPPVILLTCSDSRVDPGRIFDVGVGQLFTVQNAGGLARARGENSSTVLASIDFIVGGLMAAGRESVLLVLGHTHCGAVAAAIEHLIGGALPESAHLGGVVQTIASHVGPDVARAPGEGHAAAVLTHVRAVREELERASDLVRRAVESEFLYVDEALYHIGSGEVEWSAQTRARVG